MKTLLLNILLLWMGSLLSLPVLAQVPVPVDEVNFPDATFRKYIAIRFDTSPRDSLLSAEELLSATAIEITDNDSLYSVKGIEFFPALRMIRLQNNPNLRGLLDISSMTLLETVWAYNTGLNSFVTGTRSSSHYSQLVEIRVSNSALSGSLDISRMPALQSLQASNNQLTFIDVQQSSMFYSQLRELYLNNNNLTRLGSLTYLLGSGFTNVHLENNQLSYEERPLIDSLNFILSSNLSRNAGMPAGTAIGNVTNAGTLDPASNVANASGWNLSGWNPEFFRQQQRGIDLLSENNPHVFNPFLAVFRAELTLNNKVELHWVLKDKMEVDRFEIIRSIDRVQEQQLTVQQGRWYKNSYRFIDEFAQVISAYYRLRIIDKEGRSMYSPWLYVTMPTAGEHEVQVFPFPAQGGDYLTIVLREPTDFTLVLTDMNGVLKFSGNYANISQVQIATLGLAPGTYRIMIQTNTDRYDRLFVMR